MAIVSLVYLFLSAEMGILKILKNFKRFEEVETVLDL